MLNEHGIVFAGQLPSIVGLKASLNALPSRLPQTVLPNRFVIYIASRLSDSKMHFYRVVQHEDLPQLFLTATNPYFIHYSTIPPQSL